MNTRDYKQFAPGEYYHVYNRGNAKLDVYKDNQDFAFFLFRLKEQVLAQVRPMGRYQRRLLPQGSFSVIAFCLMPNHFHLLIRQNFATPISQLLLSVCSGYSKYFNKKYDQVGHVFQDQFKAIRVENEGYLVWLSAYIHANPVVAKLSIRGEDYAWSSYQDYLGLRNGQLCDKSVVLDKFASIGQYQDFVEESIGITQSRKELEEYLLD